MKKLFITIAAVALSASLAFAQDLATVTEIFNNGATALNSGDKVSALASFKDALAKAEALGEEGAEIVNDCKTHIPNIQFSIAKEQVNNAEYDSAVASLKETINIANTYGAAETAEEAADLIPQVLMQKANSAFNDKDYATAVEGYNAVLAEDATNGAAALRLGAAYNALGKKKEAVAAFEKAIENGQESAAVKQLSNLYLKDAAADLKAKDYAGAIEAANNVNKYGENAKAYQIIGQACQSQGKSAEAIKNFEKYLSLSPSAANYNSIAFTVAALYQKAGNKAKAKEYYQKVVNDAKFGASAQAQLNALK